jgi:hypothetical protein
MSPELLAALSEGERALGFLRRLRPAVVAISGFIVSSLALLGYTVLRLFKRR